MEEEAFSTFWEPFPMVIGKKNKPRLIARMTLLSLIKQAEGDFEKFYIASLEYALQRFTANYVRRDDFLKVIVRRQDPVLRSFLKRLFDEYAENPRFFFEVFHDATRPIMSRAYPSR
jgi:hypothetical protein